MAIRVASVIKVPCILLALFTVRFEVASAQASPAGSAASAPASAADGEEKARAHFRLGRAYYDNGDFAQAAVEFEAAYRISQRAALLYNIYLAYRDANDSRHAADALRKYLELEQNVENRGQLEARLAALDRTLAEEAANPPVATPAPGGAAVAESAAGSPLSGASGLQPSAAVETPPLPAPAPSPAPAQVPEPSPDRTVPIVLMASGGALVVGSVITGVLALGKRGELADAEDQCKKLSNCNALSATRVSALEDTRSSGKTLAIVTDVLLFGGLAVAGTGLVLFFLKSREERAQPEAMSASLACAPAGCAGRLQMHF